MKLELKKQSRIREFNKYNDITKAKVIFCFLSEGLSYRKLDEQIIGLDSKKSRGYQSMGILNYLGLKKTTEFLNMSVDEIIVTLQSFENYEELEPIVSLLALISNANAVNGDSIHIEDCAYQPVKEGKRTVYYSTKYERSPHNRAQAIRIHGTKCMAYGFDFEKNYGELGKGYIEVHHVKPLASLEDEVTVNPESDLIVLCSNCHRMIHKKKNSVLSLTELKNIIELNKND